MKQLIITLAGFVYSCIVYAVGLADFQSNFLHAPIKHVHHAKNYPTMIANTTATNTSTVVGSKASGWSSEVSEDCLAEDAYMRDSIFCHDIRKNRAKQALVTNDSKSVTVGSGSLNTTEPNQNALQSANMRSALGKYDSNYMFSIKPDDNMHLGIGAGDNGVNTFKFDMTY